jgi:hypothetical protein
MERLPRRTPTGDFDLTDLVLDALEQIPILGDIIALVNDVIEALTGVSGGGIGDLLSWVETLVTDPLAIVAQAIQAMLDALTEIVDDSIVSDLAGAIADAIRFVVNLIFGGSGGYWSEGTLVASAQVAFGVNEILAGIRLTRKRKITNIYHHLLSNTGTVTMQTKLGGTVIHTATMAGAGEFAYTVSVDAVDGDRISWNCTGSTGIANVFNSVIAGEYRS